MWYKEKDNPDKWLSELIEICDDCYERYRIRCDDIVVSVHDKDAKDDDKDTVVLVEDNDLYDMNQYFDS